MNNANIIGRLTRDPELRQTPNGISVCTFSIAVTRKHNRDEADFIPVVVWREAAENANKYLKKGDQAAVSGNLRTRDYEGNDGKRRFVMELVADNVEYLQKVKRKEDEPESEEPDPNKYRP